MKNFLHVSHYCINLDKLIYVEFDNFEDVLVVQFNFGGNKLDSGCISIGFKKIDLTLEKLILDLKTKEILPDDIKKYPINLLRFLILNRNQISTDLLCTVVEDLNQVKL